MQTKFLPYIIIGILVIAGVVGASYYYFAIKQPVEVLLLSPPEQQVPPEPPTPQPVPGEIEKPYIKVISPNGGEKWAGEETHAISWASSNVKNIIITLFQGSSRSYLIGPKTGVEASLQRFDWKIDRTASYVGRSDLRIVLYDAAYCGYVSEDIGGECAKDELSHSDASDNYFSIVGEDETANWKTYRNEKVGFEIKYPSDWKVSTYLLSTGTEISFDKGDYVVFNIIGRVYYNQDLGRNLTLKEVINNAKDSRYQAGLKEENVIIDGHPATKLSYKNTQTGLILFEVYMEKEWLIYNIVAQTDSSQEAIYNPIFNQMLSTFRFLE